MRFSQSLFAQSFLLESIHRNVLFRIFVGRINKIQADSDSWDGPCRRRLVKGRSSQTGALGRRRSEVSNECRGGRRKGRRRRRSTSVKEDCRSSATVPKGQAFSSSSSSTSSDDSDVEEAIRAVDRVGIWAGEQARELRRTLWTFQQSGKEWDPSSAVLSTERARSAKPSSIIDTLLAGTLLGLPGKESRRCYLFEEIANLRIALWPIIDVSQLF